MSIITISDSNEVNLLDKIIEYIKPYNEISVWQIQNKFGIGPTESRNIIDKLVEMGYVSPSDPYDIDKSRIVYKEINVIDEVNNNDNQIVNDNTEKRTFLFFKIDNILCILAGYFLGWIIASFFKFDTNVAGAVCVFFMIIFYIYSLDLLQRVIFIKSLWGTILIISLIISLLFIIIGVINKLNDNINKCYEYRTNIAVVRCINEFDSAHPK